MDAEDWNIPFAWTSLHGLATELTARAGALAACASFWTILGSGITADLTKLDKWCPKARVAQQGPTFFRRHSSQARETLDLFL